MWPMVNELAQARSEKISTEPMRPVGRPVGFFTGSLQSLSEVWQRRELMDLLVRREIKARYKDSSLGLLWSLVRPLAQLLIYYFAIGQILGAAKQIPDFAIFVFIGLTVWGLFVEIVANGTRSIVDNAGLVKKVYLPREVFPLASVGGALFNFAIQFGILLAATLVIGRFNPSVDLLFAPLAFLVVLLYGTALALVLSAINVYLRDIQHFVEVATIVMFWGSPIVYSFRFVNEALNGNWIEQIYLLNPITLSVLGMHRALWTAGHDPSAGVNWPPDLLVRLIIAAAAGLVFVWLSQRIFSRLQGNFAQEL